jgi:hypothetical protein
MRKEIKYEYGDMMGTCIYLKELDSEIYINSKRTRRRRMGLFKCPCGKEFKAIIWNVKSKTVQSCGCLEVQRKLKLIKRNETHKLSHNPIYDIWFAMLNRCNNVKDRNYKHYGGRGISVCERWGKIENFIEDMYPTYQKGLQIDRTDNNGNYEPSNCRWITAKQNLNNTRSNRIIEYNGMRKTVSEWADHLNVPYQTLLTRINEWDIDSVFNVPYPCPTRVHESYII